MHASAVLARCECQGADVRLFNRPPLPSRLAGFSLCDAIRCVAILLNHASTNVRTIMYVVLCGGNSTPNPRTEVGYSTRVRYLTESHGSSDAASIRERSVLPIKVIVEDEDDDEDDNDD